MSKTLEELTQEVANLQASLDSLRGLVIIQGKEIKALQGENHVSKS